MSQRNPGQSMVEFALIIPVMVLVIAGIFDLGRAFYSSITITNAAREGARYGALNRDYVTGVCIATKNEATSSGIMLNDANIQISCVPGVFMQCPVAPGIACGENLPIIVKVNYTYNEMILKFFFPTGISMERQVEMLIP